MQGRKKFFCLFSFLLLLGCPVIVSAASSLSDNIRIESKQLAYNLQYRVYLPDKAETMSGLPVVFVTDGQWYLHNGQMQEILDQEIESGRIKPVAAVFVDSRNPDKLRENRRNSEFMCNKNFALFFANELIPAVVRRFPVSHLPEDRVIMGLSFGGLNAACFGLMLPQIFPNIAMQSPASDKHVKVLAKQYREKDEALPLKIFFSNGTRRDNIYSSRAFHETLLEKGYDVTYIEVPEGHDWDNWRPLIDDLLQAFFSPDLPLTFP